ncbi:MAG: bifunctional glutamate N-acetyltransferase/amino-acid acetyltransferase ArgJ, partial [Chloroflexota bacterium]
DEVEGGNLVPKGWRAAASCAHINGSTGDKLDLALLASDRDCTAAGVFTRNQVKAAPVLWCQRQLPSTRVRAVVANSGNANACSGEQGERDTFRMAELAAARLNVESSQVLVASTGVIGIPMPMDRIAAGMADLSLGSDGGCFIDAIMTTDSRRKQAAVTFELAGRQVRIGGVTKGAGMIHPNMATMLCFLTSDVAADPALLHGALSRAANRSFNMLSIDRDTSTNDSFIILCNGAAEAPAVRPSSTESDLLEEAIERVALSLARQMAADGEGASKDLEVRVAGAASPEDAREAARGIVSSTLVKCAMYGNDPNWGRIMCALGNAPIRLDERRVSVSVAGHRLVAGGIGTSIDAAAVSAAMNCRSVLVEVDLGLGDGQATAFGCDMTPDYVRFNAEYTT